MSISAPKTLRWTEDEDFAAEMTNRQFAALQKRLDKAKLLAELASLPFMSQIQKGSTYRFETVKTRLANGWNTEYLLRLGAESFANEQLVYALQWAFPQAYYSAFSVTLGFLGSVGYTDASHFAVMKRIGALIIQGKYPGRVSFAATGGKDISFLGITRSASPSSLAFNANDAASVDTQICQFLKGTRERDLKERRTAISFKSRAGKKKKSLSAPEWDRVADSLGPTSILSLLYRKRIKANYREIDTFLNRIIEPKLLYGALVHIVACVNVVHEAFIRRAVGKKEYSALCKAANPNSRHFIVLRTESLDRVL